jgi:hypothetical protein
MPVDPLKLATRGRLGRNPLDMATVGRLSVEVIVEPSKPVGGGGGFSYGGFDAGGTFQEQMVQNGKDFRQREEDEIILLIKIFNRVCLN